MARKRGQFTDAERVAYHEAGHAVVVYCLKIRFRHISVDPKDLGGEAGGGVVAVSRSVIKSLHGVDCGGAQRSRVESFIRVLLAGVIGEGLLSGECDWRESEQDFQVALQLAGNMSGGMDEQIAYVTWLWESTKNLLSYEWRKEAVHDLARALLKDGKVGYRRARAIIATAEMAAA